MTISKITKIRDIVVQPDGALFVKIGLLVMEGSAVLGSRTHSLRIEPGADVDAAIGEVNDHLSSGILFNNPNGPENTDSVTYPPVSPEDIARLKGVRAAYDAVQG